MLILLRMTCILVMLGMFRAQTNLPVLPDSPRITASNAPSLNVSEVSLDDVESSVRQIAFSSDGRFVAVAVQVGDSDYSITVHEVVTEELVLTIQGRMDFFHEMVWSPNSRRIAVISGRRTGAGVEERSVKLYSIDAGLLPQPYLLGASDVWLTDYIYPDSLQPSQVQGYPVDLAWNWSSELIAFAFIDRLVVYDAVQDTELVSFSLEGIYAVEWSPDGKYLITESEKVGVQVWHAADDG